MGCKQKTLTLITTEGENLMYQGGNSNHTVPLISTAKACKLVEKGCNASPCAVEVIETIGLEPNDIPLVQEFLEVFQEVRGLPPD